MLVPKTKKFGQKHITHSLVPVLRRHIIYSCVTPCLKYLRLSVWYYPNLKCWQRIFCRCQIGQL